MTDKVTDPVLWSRSGVLHDAFVPVATLEDIADKEAVLLPLNLWVQLDQVQRRYKNIRIGVKVEADETLDGLLDDLAYLDLITLDFPTFNDGRSFSKAARLRSHYGFAGEIRATGAVHIDQVIAMLRSGFDSLQITDPLTLKRVVAGELHDTGAYYQPAADGNALYEQKADRYVWRSRTLKATS